MVHFLQKELELPSSQLLGLFNRSIRKVVQVSSRLFSFQKSLRFDSKITTTDSGALQNQLVSSSWVLQLELRAEIEN